MATHVVPSSTSLASQLSALERWIPLRPIIDQVAQLYLTRDARARMMPADDGRNVLRGTAGAAFDQFVELGTSAHELFHASWGRLGIAQLKVMSPDPGTRLIGAFVSPLLFVGLQLYWRDELDFKATGQQGLIDYKTLGKQAAAEWDTLLPGIRRQPMKDFKDE